MDEKNKQIIEAGSHRLDLILPTLEAELGARLWALREFEYERGKSSLSCRYTPIPDPVLAIAGGSRIVPPFAKCSSNSFASSFTSMARSRYALGVMPVPNVRVT